MSSDEGNENNQLPRPTSLRESEPPNWFVIYSQRNASGLFVKYGATSDKKIADGCEALGWFVDRMYITGDERKFIHYLFHQDKDHKFVRMDGKFDENPFNAVVSRTLRIIYLRSLKNYDKMRREDINREIADDLDEQETGERVSLLDTNNPGWEELRQRVERERGGLQRIIPTESVPSIQAAGPSSS